MKNKLLIVPLLFLTVIVFGTNLNAQTYCEPGATNTSRYIKDFSTTQGVLNITNNGSGFSTGGHGLFLSQTVSQAKTESVSFSAEVVGGTAGFRIWVDWDQDGTFSSSEVAYSSSSYESVHTGSFVVPGLATEGTTRMRVVSHWLSASGDAGPCETVYTYGEFEDYTFEVLPAPTCPQPSALAQTAITASSVDVDWTENGSATTWNVEVGLSGFTPGTGNEVTADNGNTTQSSTLTGLADNTSYDVYVQADCGPGDQSNWVGPLTITTPPTPQTPVSTFPWIEDFETGGSEWTYLNGLETNQWFVGSAINNGGSNAMYVTNDGGATHAYNILSSSVVHAYRDISLPVGIASAELSFDFLGRGEGSSDYLRVFAVPLTFNPTVGSTISTSGSAPAGRVRLGDAYINKESAFISKRIEIPAAYIGEDFRIVFQWRNDGSVGDNPPAAVDNISIQTFDCLSVIGLDTLNVTDTEATLVWNDTITGSIANYTVEYGPVGFTLGSGTSTAVTDTFLALTGLTNNQAYEFYVRRDCGNGSFSAFTGPKKFLTLPTPQTPVSTFPWIEDFETGGTEWTYMSGSQANRWFVGSAVANGGSNSLYISKDNGVTHEYDNGSTSTVHAYRDISLPAGIASAELSFDFLGKGEGIYDYLRVYAVPLTFDPASGSMIAITGSAPTGRVRLSEMYINQESAFVSKRIEIPSDYIGEDFRLVFQWRNDGSGGQQPPAAVDNISIQTYNCVTPYGLVSSDQGKFGATVSWNDSISSPNFTVEYGHAGFVPGTGTTVTVSDTFAVLTGLTSDQQYDYYVSGECSDASFSPQVTGSFTTLVACAVPTNLSVVSLTDESVELTWNVPIGGASTFDVEYGLTGFVPGTGTTVTAPPAVISGLSGSTTYDFYVIAQCGGSNGPSQQAGPLTVTTDLSCKMPTNISITEVGPDSVVIAWDPNGSTNWVIEYDTAGFVQGASTNSLINTSTNPYILTGLDPSHTYDMYVWADCAAGGLSDTTSVISFTTQPPCPNPTNLTVDLIGADTAVVAWDANGTINWVVAYDSIGFTIGNPGSSSISTSSNPLTITGLSPESSYEVYVWADCAASGVSDTLGSVSFTTQPLCPAPSNIVISDIGADTAVVSWTANGPTNWIIEYDTIGFTPGSTGATTVSPGTNPFTLTGLSPEFNYSVYVWSDCATDGTSDTISPASFITQPSCLAPSNIDVDVYSDSSAEVTWDENGTATVWNIEYGIAPFLPGSGTMVFGVTNPDTIPVIGDENYQVYVQSVCSTTDSSTWFGPYDFDTKYCTASTGSSFDEIVYIETTNAIQDVSYDVSGAYSAYVDETAQVIVSYVGQTFDVETGYDGGSHRMNVWVDWNNNYSFDATELEYTGTSSAIQSFTLTVPAGTPNGDYRMRVRGSYGPPAVLSPCGQVTYGSTVDFTLRVEDVPTCFKPTNLDVSAVDDVSAIISWDIEGSASSYIVEWGEEGYTVGTGTSVVVTDTFALITGLPSSDRVDAYVRSICSVGDTSTYLGPITFLTQCGTYNALGFCEGFDIDNSPTIGCWRVINANGDGTNWAVSTANPHTGAYSAYISTSGNNGANDDYIITPGLEMTGVEMMNFFYRVGSSSSPNDFQVLLSTTGTDIADFTDTLMHLAAYNNTTYRDSTVDLTMYSGQTVFIAFHIPPGGLNGSSLYIDDVCFLECIPTAGTDGSFDVCSTDGTVSLTDGIITNSNTSGVWKYPANQSLIQDDTMFVVTDLPTGAHDVYYIVQGACEPDTTVATINVFRVSSAGNGSTITVCKNDPIDLYSALSGNVDVGGVWYDYNGVALPSSQPNAPGLGAQYNYTYIASNGLCASDTSIVEVIVDPSCSYWGVGEEQFVDISVYPNPATTQLNIVNPSNTSSLRVEMLDMNGRVVLVENKALNNASEATLAIDHLERGIYTLRVYNDEGQRTFKVVKQ